ncbi:hypothetical protein MFFC18_21020 [Mariniblastus fucicola]|uniref:Uncharacterized protein n=1 Tax=Mariniblastus fucicola TaxID=980251 RepID=A0A5B9PCH3_9BACT|nr:hypothetical protein MFFC18_21020 [Mariniblastus fucicola]
MNPYETPTVKATSQGKTNNRYGYVQVSVGYGLLALYVFIVSQLGQLANSTATFDRVAFRNSLVWLVPFLVLIPWLSYKSLTPNNLSKIRISSAILLLIFLVCTTLVLPMFDYP